MNIIRSLPNNSNKTKLLNISNSLNNDTIASVYNDNMKMYINLDNNGTDRMIIDNGKHYIVPYFNFKMQDRLLIIINGYSRSGKSIFLSNYVIKNYVSQKRSKIFYICPTHPQQDESLRDIDLIYINASQIELNDNEKALKQFQNSMVIIDDIDSIKNVDVWRLLSLVVNVGGKFKIDVCFITHANTIVIQSLKLNMISDCDYYITYNIVNNRFYNTYNKDAPIAEFKDDTIVTCRPKYKIIMSDKRIIKY